MRNFLPARILASAASVALAAGLVACSSGEDPETAPGDETTASSPAPETPESEEESSSAPTTSSPRSNTNARDSEPGEDVQEVKELFGVLAPDELFAEFDSCNPTGLEDSYECSGSDVGQFQFFESQSKAASTTQLLTELRSSRVVEDTGRRVVGWSTLGTTAVITVIDNEEGLVMQQMVSSDLVEPEERIRELGLVEEPSTTTSNSNSDPAPEVSDSSENTITPV